MRDDSKGRWVPWLVLGAVAVVLLVAGVAKSRDVWRSGGAYNAAGIWQAWPR